MEILILIVILVWTDYDHQRLSAVLWSRASPQCHRREPPNLVSLLEGADIWTGN